MVKSDSLAPYAKVLAGFTAESKAEVSEYDLKGSENRAEKLFETLRDKPPALIVAVGPIAANAARRTVSSIPVVFVMVPNYEKYGLEARNVTGIALTLPPRFQLQTLHSLVGSVKRVGVVYNASLSQAVIDAATADAAALGLSLVPVTADAPEHVGKALGALVGKVDALWMIADRTVAHATAVQKMIEFSTRQKLPLLALSEGQVKDGALLSLSPNLSALGGQAARLANRIVFEKIDPGAMAVQQPEGVDVAVNLGTARKLGSQCDFAMDVLRLASQSGYAVRVYE